MAQDDKEPYEMDQEEQEEHASLQDIAEEANVKRKQRED